MHAEITGRQADSENALAGRLWSGGGTNKQVSGASVSLLVNNAEDRSFGERLPENACSPRCCRLLQKRSNLCVAALRMFLCFRQLGGWRPMTFHNRRRIKSNKKKRKV